MIKEAAYTQFITYFRECQLLFRISHNVTTNPIVEYISRESPPQGGYLVSGR
jgi:hypothetical protein